MSQAPHETMNINAPDAGIGEIPFSHTVRSLPFSLSGPAPIGGNPYPPQSAPAQAPQGVPDFVDGSGPIFSMYLEMAKEEDEKMAENWKADAEGILIFVRLYRLN